MNEKALTAEIRGIRESLDLLINMMRKREEQETVSAKVAAGLLGVSLGTLRKNYSFLPRKKQGRSYIYLKKSIIDYINSHQPSTN